MLFFARLNQADPVSGVDMTSTGEVGCIGDDFNEALLKALLSVGMQIPRKAVLISSGDAIQKADLLEACHLLHKHGYELWGTRGSRDYLQANGIPAKLALWPGEKGGKGDVPVQELIKEHRVDLVVNIPKNFTRTELTNGYKIRRAAVDFNVPLITNARLATAFITAFCTLPAGGLKIKAWDEYKN